MAKNSSSLEKVPLSVQDVTDTGTLPQGNLISAPGDPLPLPSDSTDFHSFVSELNELIKLGLLQNPDFRCFAFSGFAPFAYITPDRRRTYALCTCLAAGKHIALLEISTPDSKNISTLIFKTSNWNEGYAASEYVQSLLDHGGQWDLDSPIIQRAERVRHCRHRAKALWSHIEKLVSTAG
jgi:hypothetical protein